MILTAHPNRIIERGLMRDQGISRVRKLMKDGEGKQ